VTHRRRPNHIPTIVVALEQHPDWNRRRCQGQDPKLFHQDDGERWEKARHRLEYAAKTLCRHCPVLEACREQGNGAEWGLWGGVFHRRDHGSGHTEIDLLEDES
jgi:Transcription factor WhiB